MAKKKAKKKELKTTVPDVIMSEQGVPLVPITEGRIAALAGGGQDVKGLIPAVNEDGWDIDGGGRTKEKKTF